jgi:Tol biopolymer transport system component
VFSDRLDRVAVGFIAVLLAIIAIVIVRGDQVGVQIIRTAPAANDNGVGTRSQLVLAFSEPMPSASLQGRILITPELSGALRWNGTTGFYVPDRPLVADTTYTVTVLPGARSERGRLMLHELTWSFRTGHPRVIYLSPATEAGNLYVKEIGPDSLERPITSEPYGVFDFAVSPDGRQVVYSATRDSSGARDLWVINTDGSERQRVVICDEQVCQTPSWSADSTRIAFERRTLVQGVLGKSPGASRIWIYDFTTKTTTPLANDSQQLGSLPRWAPVGDKLSYYDPIAGSVTIIDTISGDQVQLPSVLGDSGTWSPNAQQLIYPELKAFDQGQFNQMLRADLVSNIITAVMPLSATNDSSVVWSPLGSIIAFTRQRIGMSGATGGPTLFGPQIWVSTPDGNTAHALTDDGAFSYGGLAWSPDGDWVVAVRNNLQMPNPKPEVWLVRSDGGAHYQLAQDATIPAWIP